MKHYKSARCAAKINGVPCGLSANYHSVEQRLKTNVPPIGHGFVFAQGVSNDAK